MFRTAKQLAKGTVTVIGQGVKLGTRVVGTVATEIIATPTEAVCGKNALSDGLRTINRGVISTTETVVDLGTPVAARLAGAPFTKAEHIKELAAGALQAASPEKREEGLRRLRKVAPYAVVSIATLGLVDEDDLLALLEFLGIGADALGDGTAAAAGALAASDPAGAIAQEVAETMAGAGAEDAAAASTLAASTNPPHGMGSRVADAIRFSGESPLELAKRLAVTGDTETLKELLQEVIDRLPPAAPIEVRERLFRSIIGGYSEVPQALAAAEPFVDLPRLVTNIRFRGST